MQRFKSEFAHSYTTYSFGYCEYATLERGDYIDDAYRQGFLPYSGSPGIAHTLYMARSARVNLKTFSPNSENRRILKRFDGKLTRHVAPLSKFPKSDPCFLDFCLDYFAKRHGVHVMPRERLDTVLRAGFITHIVTYTDAQGTIVGYVFLCASDTMSHYWFSFYDLKYAYQSLGLWMMLDCARMAQEERKAYFYVGTVYGEKALYKTNIDSLEFWNGNAWDTNIKHLRDLSKRDGTRIHDGTSLWKTNLPVFDH